MVTTIGLERRLEHLLEDLARLDFDAATAYQAAIERLTAPGLKAAMRAFKGDHLRHTRELGAQLRAMGHPAPHEGDLKQLLTTGKVMLAGLIGDKAILAAMRTNEDDTVMAYDRAAKFKGCTAAVRRVLERARADEHRHRAWMIAALAADPTGRRTAGRTAAAAKRQVSAKRTSATRTSATRTGAKRRPTAKRRISAKSPVRARTKAKRRGAR